MCVWELENRWSFLLNSYLTLAGKVAAPCVLDRVRTVIN